MIINGRFYKMTQNTAKLLIKAVRKIINIT